MDREDKNEGSIGRKLLFGLKVRLKKKKKTLTRERKVGLTVEKA